MITDEDREQVKPYTYQRFPAMLYHHEKRLTKVVHNEEQEKAHVKSGYSKEPFVLPAEAETADLAPARLDALEERIEVLEAQIAELLADKNGAAKPPKKK